MGKYKKTKSISGCIACFSVCAALAGCKEAPTLPPSENMQLVTTPARTSSTYTGTTVEYVPTSASNTGINVFNGIDFPEFPQMDMQAGDNPFGSEFYALFGGSGVSEVGSGNAEYPDYSVSAEDDGREQLPSSETSAPITSMDSIFISSEDIPWEAMTDITGLSAVRVESAFPGEQMPDFTFSSPDEITQTTLPPIPEETFTEVCGTYPVTEGFDIREYMPPMEDFPDFGEIEFDTADFGVR